MDEVIDTIGQHLADLETLSLTNNNLRTLRVLGKIVERKDSMQANIQKQNLIISDKLCK